MFLVHLATNTLASTENLLHRAGESATERLVAHRPRDLDNLVNRNVAAVRDILRLLAVTQGLFESLDDQR